MYSINILLETAGKDSAAADPVAEPVPSEYVGVGACNTAGARREPLLEKLPADDNSLREESEVVQDFADWEEFGLRRYCDCKTEYANYFAGRSDPDRPMRRWRISGNT